MTSLLIRLGAKVVIQYTMFHLEFNTCKLQLNFLSICFICYSDYFIFANIPVGYTTFHALKGLGVGYTRVPAIQAFVYMNKVTC